MIATIRARSWWATSAAALLLSISMAAPAARASYMSAVLADGPEAYWRFEDGNEGAILNGTTAADATGNHPGMYKQAGAADGPQLTAGAPGVGGTAAHFVGTSATVGDYIIFDTLGDVGSNIDNNGLTFEFLMKNPVPFSSAAANSHRLFGIANDRPTTAGASRRLTLSFGFSDLNLDQNATNGNEDSIFLREQADNAWGYSTNLGGTDMDDGNWHHVAWVIDPGVPVDGTHVYVDGVPITLVASVNTLFTPKALSNFANFDKPFTLGAEHLNTTPPGTAPLGNVRTFALNNIIDEFAVYSKALSAQQIALHAAAAGVPEPSTACLLGIALALVAFRRRKTQ